jgi:hypothetical protein
MDEPNIQAGVLSIAHSENDPGLGDVIEASDVKAIVSVLAEGTSVHDSVAILARKAAGLAHVIARRDAGVGLIELLAEIAQGGPPWTR